MSHEEGLPDLAHVSAQIREVTGVLDLHVIEQWQPFAPVGCVLLQVRQALQSGLAVYTGGGYHG